LARGMNLQANWIRGLAIVWVALVSTQPAPAALPCLKEKPWFAYFLVLRDKKFNFGLSGTAEGMLTPMGKTGKPITQSLTLPLAFMVEEILPNGRSVSRKILADSLTTKDAATAKPGQVTFRGKVTGGASFEGHIEVEHGVVAVGGHLLDAGTLKANPLRFGIRITFPSAYRHKPQIDKQAARLFEEMLKDDHFSILWTDDKHVRLTGNDALEAGSKKVNGPGIAGLRVEVSAYQGKSFEFKATKNSKMELWCRLRQPLHRGFSINWYPDPSKDPEGKARLTFDVK
jgi:hypothetical protein